MVTISRSTKKKDRTLFEQVPEIIHRDDPNYVPPFPGTVSKMLGEQSHFKQHGTIIPFIAFRDSKPVGRIAAVVNRSHNKYHNDKTGFFGFFDSIDDTEVSRALYQAAKEELLKHSLDNIRGPYNPSINDESGLLVDGFEEPPSILMPYNPAYYLKLYDDLGLTPAHDLYAFYMYSAEEASTRMKKIVERVRRSTGVSLRTVDLNNFEQELLFIRELYNATLCRNWGYVPVTEQDLAHAAKDLKPIVRPEMLLIAEKDEKPVGFSLCIPNINEFLHKTRGSGRLMRILKFIWQLKTKHPTDTRLAVLGVHPEYRNTGIAALFYYESLQRAKGRYRGGELSWVEDTNSGLIKSLKFMGGKITKTYRVFENSLVN